MGLLKCKVLKKKMEITMKLYVRGNIRSHFYSCHSFHLDSCTSSVQCKLNFHPKMFKNWVTQSPKQQIIKTCCTLMRLDDDAISTSRGTPEIYIEALSHQLALISNPVSFSFCLSLFSSISSFITWFFPFSPVLTEQTDS